MVRVVKTTIVALSLVVENGLNEVVRGWTRGTRVRTEKVG